MAYACPKEEKGREISSVMRIPCSVDALEKGMTVCDSIIITK
jgi:hypothetical protein